MQNAFAEKRVKFDFEIDFSNGGGIQGQDFRLDIEGDDTEHLCNLDKLPIEGFTFTAVPLRLKGMGTFPVRAFARLGVA